MGDAEFKNAVQNLAGCYAYTLGYADPSGALHGLRIDPDQPNAFTPIVADRPPADVENGNFANSPNHAGYGQNVLYIDGHAAFWKTRNAGVDGDDIFLNFDRKVAAGKSRFDSVLGASLCRP